MLIRMEETKNSGNCLKDEAKAATIIFEMDRKKERDLKFMDFRVELKDLNLRVRQKALQIANHLYREGGLSKQQAIRRGIALAEEWWLNMNG